MVPCLVLAWSERVHRTRTERVQIDAFETFGRTSRERLDAFVTLAFERLWSLRRLIPLFQGRLAEW